MTKFSFWLPDLFRARPMRALGLKPTSVVCTCCRRKVEIWHAYADGQVLCVPCAGKVK